LTFCQFLYNQCVEFHVGVNLSTIQQYFQTNNTDKNQILKARQVSMARLGVATKDNRDALGSLLDVPKPNPTHQPAALMAEKKHAADGFSL
jgi:hypothetical protein